MVHLLVKYDTKRAPHPHAYTINATQRIFLEKMSREREKHQHQQKEEDYEKKVKKNQKKMESKWVKMKN